MSRNALCAFCGRSTVDALPGEYLELEVTVPDVEGPQRQLLGAHTKCMNEALQGVKVEVDALLN